jgi:hypothetical protein
MMKADAKRIEGIAVQRANGSYAVFVVDGRLLRTPARGVCRWFKTEAEAIKAALKAR